MDVKDKDKDSIEDVSLTSETFKEVTAESIEEHQKDVDKNSSKLLLAQKHMSNEKYDLAVECLMAQSKLGCVESTKLLQKCLDTNKGITEENCSRVQWCLETPRQDKIAINAARQLYRAINPTREPMNRDVFLYKVRNSQFTSVQKKMIGKAAKLKSLTDLITEEHFVERMVHKLTDGTNLGFVLNVELGEEVQKTTSQLKNFMSKPMSAISTVGDHTVNIAAKQGMSWLRSCIPTHQIHLLIVFSLYSLLSIHLILKTLPLLVFYISFVAMILATVRMYYNKCKLHGIHTLASLLQFYQSDVDEEKYSHAFIQRSLVNYIIYFPAAFIAIISFSMADIQWIPSGEFLFVAIFFSGFAFFTLCKKSKLWQWLGLGLRCSSLLPAFVSGFPSIPVLYTLVQIFFGTPLQFNLIPDARLGIGLPTIAHLLLPIVYVALGSHNKWRGVLECLLPQLVVALWLEIVLLFFKASTIGNIFSGFISCVLLIIFLPFFGVGLILWVLFCVLEMVSFGGILKLFVALIAIALPAALAVWAKSGFRFAGTDINSTSGKVMLVVLSAFSVLPMIYIITPPERNVGDNYLSWEDYRNYCSEPEWNRSSIAHAQTICAHFQGSMVEWEGVVKKVVIKKTENQVDSLISHLPWTVSNWLKCSFGEEYPKCSEVEDEEEKALCHLRTMQGATCHLRNMDHFLFEIWLQMPIDGDNMHDIRVTAHHKFRKTISQLRAGNTIHVRASLQSDLGNVWPVMKLFFIECVDCMMRLEEASTELQDEELITTIMRLIRQAMFNVLNVFTAPFVIWGSE